MKVLILFLMACVYANAQITAEMEAKWIDFKINFGKLFLSPGKEQKRKEVFFENVKGLDEHNEAYERGEVTYTVAINQWADLTDEEFESRFMGIPKDEPETRARPAATYLNAAYPDSLDLRTDAGVTPVKNQNPCGSCWAFSTLSATEYAVWKKTGKSLDLSEQQLVDCSGYSDGCQGGWMYEAMDYIAANGGVYNEVDYPYAFGKVANQCAKPNKAKPVQLQSNPSYMLFANQDATIKAALKYYGVLSICVDATGWRWTMNGIFQSSKDQNHVCTHAVSLVGYGKENGVPYWIIKNSWSDQWAENGFIRVDATRLPNGLVKGGITFEHAYFPLIK